MSGYVTLSGTIVAMGSGVTLDGVMRYDLIRVRTKTNGIQKIESVFVGATVDSFLTPGTTAVFYIKSEDGARSTAKMPFQTIFAVRTEEDEGDDIEFMAKMKGRAIFGGWGMALCALPLCLILVGFPILAKAIGMLRFAYMLPDLAPMTAAFSQRETTEQMGEIVADPPPVG